LRRLDKAFKAFFARCAKGQTPGFPRYKSIARMPGIGFKSHGDGWRFAPNLANDGRPDDFGVIRWDKHGALRLQGLGHIKCRGQARAAGVIKSCELLYAHGEWEVSVTMECADVDVARVRTAHHAAAADWGVNSLLKIVRTDGVHKNGTPNTVTETIENPRWFKSAQDRLISLDRAVSSKKRGSNNWRKAGKSRGQFRSKLARKRHDHQHQITSDVSSWCAIFATEKLNIKNMTGSAAGTVDEPGKNVRQKAGLNREVLDTAPAGLLQKMNYKVIETGGLYLEAPTRQLKPSQTCPAPGCGAQQKKLLQQRWHCCHICGHEEDRDEASARVVLQWALGTLENFGTQDALHPKKSKDCGQELPKAA
jgi:putative transposase